MATFSQYVLDNEGNPVVETDTTLWAKTLSDIKRRRVALTDFFSGVKISTVFLGINHGTEEKPLFFETRVEGKGAIEDETQRWATWADALEGHRMAVQEVLDVDHKVRRNEEWARPTVPRKSQWDRLTDDDDL